jgi:hypothetical protein
MTETTQTTRTTVGPDYGTALTWYFKDPLFGNVVMQFSLLILSCIFILPVFYVAPLMLGYLIATIRNVQKGKYALPEVDANVQWKDGAMLMLVNLAVGVVVATISFSISMLVSFSSIALGSDASSEFSFFSGMLAIFGSFINIAINLVVVFVEMLMVVIYAKTGSLNDLISLENYQTIMRNNGSTVIISMILMYVVGSVVPMIGFLFCCIGILPASVIITFITAGLYGQISTEGLPSLVEQEVVKATEA